MYRTIRYDSYDTHTVSYDSWALTICRYDIKLFTHDTIRIAYRTIRIAYHTILTTMGKMMNLKYSRLVKITHWGMKWVVDMTFCFYIYLYIYIYILMELSHVVSRLAPNQANNSYAWQSILKARSVISFSSKWRIGDG